MNVGANQLGFAFPAALDAPATVEPEASAQPVVIEEPEPQWLKDRRQAEREALDAGTTISERKSWERAAAIGRQRIADQYQSRRRTQ